MMIWFSDLLLVEFMRQPDAMPLAKPLLIFVVRNIALSIIMTVVFLETRGSVLPAVLLHLVNNMAISILIQGLSAPSIEHYEQIFWIDIGLLWVLALGLLAWFGNRPADRAARMA